MENFDFHKNFSKEKFYNFLQVPTRENLIKIIFEGSGEEDNIEFKEKWIGEQAISKIILGMANSGGGVIIFGIEDNNNTFSAKGLEKLEDKADINNKLANYLPEILKPEILNFDFNGENYSKIKGKLFQVILIKSEDIQLPYILKKGGNEDTKFSIFVRRGTKTENANSAEIDEIIKKRIEAEYTERSDLKLEDHLNQLKILYNYNKPNFYNPLFENCFLNSKQKFYEFISKIIEKKKKVIEKYLEIF